MSSRGSNSCEPAEYFDPVTSSCHSCIDCSLEFSNLANCSFHCTRKCESGKYYDPVAKDCFSCADCLPPKTPMKYCDQCSDLTTSTTSMPTNTGAVLGVIVLCVIAVIFIIIICCIVRYRRRQRRDVQGDQEQPREPARNGAVGPKAQQPNEAVPLMGDVTAEQNSHIVQEEQAPGSNSLMYGLATNGHLPSIELVSFVPDVTQTPGLEQQSSENVTTASVVSQPCQAPNASSIVCPTKSSGFFMTP